MFVMLNEKRRKNGKTIVDWIHSAIPRNWGRRAQAEKRQNWRKNLKNGEKIVQKLKFAQKFLNFGQKSAKNFKILVQNGGENGFDAFLMVGLLIFHPWAFPGAVILTLNPQKMQRNQFSCHFKQIFQCFLPTFAGKFNFLSIFHELK